MAELSLLTEEFPEEADSGMLRTLRVKLEKELVAMAERQAQARQRHRAAVSPPATQADEAVHAGGAAHGAPGEPCLANTPAGYDVPERELQDVSCAGTVPDDAPCRLFRGACSRLMARPRSGTRV